MVIDYRNPKPAQFSHKYASKNSKKYAYRNNEDIYLYR